MGNWGIRRALTVLVVATLASAGCGGGGAKVEASSTSTTMGQELMDLEAAHRQGIIDQKQYETAKKQILKRYQK
jgi:hypothetical protein